MKDSAQILSVERRTSVATTRHRLFRFLRLGAVMKVLITKRDPKERALVYAQFDKVNRLIFDNAPSRDVSQALDVLSRLTRIRRERHG